jgi:CheY-like chemotaxis protein
MSAYAPILVVDDEECVVALLAEVLSDAGYEVRVASNGASALTAVQKYAPALILLDNMMPGKSGIEVARSLRQQGYDDLPVIMMSAATPEEQLRAAGATDYLTKPFDLDDVLDCVGRYVGSTQLTTA